MADNCCPNCGYSEYDGATCFQCGYGPKIGPEPEVGEESWKFECPQCHRKTYDGWDCSFCGYGISLKARRSQAKVLSPAEDAQLRKRFAFFRK